MIFDWVTPGHFAPRGWPPFWRVVGTRPRRYAVPFLTETAIPLERGFDPLSTAFQITICENNSNAVGAEDGAVWEISCPARCGIQRFFGLL